MAKKGKKDIVIVGLGLMGASLGLRLGKKFKSHRIVGLSRSASKIKKAIRRKVIDVGFTSPQKAFQSASIIVIATPVNEIQKFILKADRLAPKGAIVTDLGSTKEVLFKWAKKKKFKNIDYIGSHPLAGSHLNGLENAFDSLYTDATCFVTLDLKTKTKSLETITSFWKRVGSRVCLITPEDHDRLLAASSHFPHLLTFALINHTSKNNPDSFAFAGTGYKDLTRIAQSLPEIWRDISMTNRKNILKESKGLIKELQHLNRLIEKGSKGQINQYFKKASSIRSKL